MASNYLDATRRWLSEGFNPTRENVEPSPSLNFPAGSASDEQKIVSSCFLHMIDIPIIRILKRIAVSLSNSMCI